MCPYTQNWLKTPRKENCRDPKAVSETEMFEMMKFSTEKNSVNEPP